MDAAAAILFFLQIRSKSLPPLCLRIWNDLYGPDDHSCQIKHFYYNLQGTWSNTAH